MNIIFILCLKNYGLTLMFLSLISYSRDKRLRTFAELSVNQLLRVEGEGPKALIAVCTWNDTLQAQKVSKAVLALHR